jgi:sigma-B regulation protein RsbU (phosphoserine phosphatase)
MTVANSGIPRPIICRNGDVDRIESTGLPLGLFEEADYDEVSVSSKSGDLFVFMSDGIVDATSPSGEQFGRKRLEDIVHQNWSRNAAEVVQGIFDAVNAHRQSHAVFDDETVLAVKVK